MIDVIKTIISKLEKILFGPLFQTENENFSTTILAFLK